MLDLRARLESNKRPIVVLLDPPGQVIGAVDLDVRCSVFVARTASHARMLLDAQETDVFCTDLEIDGMVATRFLFSLGRRPRTAVVQCELQPRLEHVPYFAPMGISMWLAPPLKGEALRRALARVLGPCRIAA